MRTFTITNEPDQEFQIPFEDDDITVNVRFLPMVEIWQISVTYQDEIIASGIKLSAEVLLLNQLNKPFAFYVKDNVGIGTDPFGLNNFNDGLYTFVLLERSELDELRGYSVE